MSLTTEGLSAADVAAVCGNNNGGIFGGDNAWFIIILFLFAFLGWGGNGWGGNGGGQGAADNYVLASDFAQVERKIDGVYSGICDSTFSLNNGINNGFAAAQNTMTQGFAGLNTVVGTQGYETRNAITQAQIAQMQSTNALTAQIADCCCQNRYDALQNAMTTNNAIQSGFCQTNYNNANNTRDLIENQNANARAILEAINANKVEALKDRIAEQNQTIQALNLTASQVAQNQYLVDKLGTKCPIPSYLVCNPNAPLNYSVNYGNGCGCA